jgi:hypothetical protein
MPRGFLSSIRLFDFNFVTIGPQSCRWKMDHDVRAVGGCIRCSAMFQNLLQVTAKHDLSGMTPLECSSDCHRSPSGAIQAGFSGVTPARAVRKTRSSRSLSCLSPRRSKYLNW